MFDVWGTDFQKLGTVENPSSANYSIYWQEIGGITLIAAATAENLRLLENDRYILVKDPKRRGEVNETVYIICNVSLNEEKAEITVNGKTAGYLLHGRAMEPLVLENTRALEAVAALANDNLRGLPMVCGTMGELPDTEIIRYPMDGGAVDENAEALMQYCGCGVRVWLDGDHFCYNADSGRDKTSLISVPVFGRGSGTARNPTIAIDTSEYCNVATATLDFTDGHSESAAIGDVETVGVARRELYCGEITQESGEDAETFLARAKKEMQGLLAEHVKRVSVSADIDADDLSMYQLGDIIPVKIGGFLAPKRITGIVWLKDQLNDKAVLKLGDPIRTIIADIKDKTKNVSRSVGGVSTKLANTDEKVKLVQEDYKSLFAKVDGVVSGMDAYVLNKVFDEYKLAVARLFATMEDADASLKLTVEDNKKAADDAIAGITKAQASLRTLVDGAQASIDLIATADALEGLKEAKTTLYAEIPEKARAEIKLYAVESGGVTKTLAEILADQVSVMSKVNDKTAGLDTKVGKAALDDALKNYALTSALGDYLTTTAAAELYVTSGGVTSIIGNYIVTDKNTGRSKSLAQILADQILLQGRVDLSGVLSVSNGVITSTGQIISQKNIRANTGLSSTGLSLDEENFVMAGKSYEPKEITSTTGAVLALGYA